MFLMTFFGSCKRIYFKVTLPALVTGHKAMLSVLLESNTSAVTQSTNRYLTSNADKNSLKNPVVMKPQRRTKQ